MGFLLIIFTKTCAKPSKFTYQANDKPVVLVMLIVIWVVNSIYEKPTRTYILPQFPSFRM